MWKAITYVSSGITLLAFIAALAAWTYRRKMLERERILQLAPEAARAGLVERVLEVFSIDTEGLTRRQKYDLALQQIHARASRFRTTAIVVVIIAFLAAFVSIFAISKESVKPNQNLSTTDSPDLRVTPSEDEVAVNLAAVDTATAPGHYVAADPYLFDYGISVSDRVPPKSKVVIANNLALYDGRSVHPTTAQNFLTQFNTDNAPASFKLLLKKPCETVSFTRPVLLALTKSGITHPAWSAHALDEEGRELSSQIEGLTQSYSNVPERTYTLAAPGSDRIAAVRFDSDPRLNGKPFSAFSAILIERLTMRCKGSK